MSDFYNYATLLAIISLFQTGKNKTEKKINNNNGVDPVSFCRDIATVVNILVGTSWLSKTLYSFRISLLLLYSALLFIYLFIYYNSVTINNIIIRVVYKRVIGPIQRQTT